MAAKKKSTAKVAAPKKADKNDGKPSPDTTVPNQNNWMPKDIISQGQKPKYPSSPKPNEKKTTPKSGPKDGPDSRKKHQDPRGGGPKNGPDSKRPQPVGPRGEKPVAPVPPGYKPDWNVPPGTPWKPNSPWNPENKPKLPNPPKKKPVPPKSKGSSGSAPRRITTMSAKKKGK